MTDVDQLDSYTAKYDTDGNMIWSINMDGEAHLNDKTTNITIDADSNIVITGSSEEAPGEYEYLTIKFTEKDIITPTDFNGEKPNASFLYYRNKGQIIDTDGDPVPTIKYYSTSSSPSFYFQRYGHSIVFSKIDTSSSSNDTLHRIDVTFSRYNESRPLQEMTLSKIHDLF